MALNRAAQQLGRLGGAKNTPAQQAARNKNIEKAKGRRADYRVTAVGPAAIRLERRLSDDSWDTMTTFRPAQLIYLAEWLRANRPQAFIYWLAEDGTFSLMENP